MEQLRYEYNRKFNACSAIQACARGFVVRGGFHGAGIAQTRERTRRRAELKLMGSVLSKASWTRACDRLLLHGVAAEPSGVALELLGMVADASSRGEANASAAVAELEGKSWMNYHLAPTHPIHALWTACGDPRSAAAGKKKSKRSKAPKFSTRLKKLKGKLSAIAGLDKSRADGIGNKEAKPKFQTAFLDAGRWRRNLGAIAFVGPATGASQQRAMGGHGAKPYLQLRDLDLIFAKAKKPTERALGPEEFVFGLQEVADAFYKKQWVAGRRALHEQAKQHQLQTKLSPGGAASPLSQMAAKAAQQKAAAGKHQAGGKSQAAAGRTFVIVLGENVQRGPKRRRRLVAFLRDQVFPAPWAKSARKALKSSVDAYVDDCAAQGQRLWRGLKARARFEVMWAKHALQEFGSKRECDCGSCVNWSAWGATTIARWWKGESTRAATMPLLMHFTQKHVKSSRVLSASI